MNPDTGEVREFRSQEEARAAGFTVPVARPVRRKPDSPLHCKFCGRHYPRRRLQVGVAQNWPRSPKVIVCGCCVTKHAGVLAKAGIRVPGAKRRRILAASCRTYDRRMCR